MPIIYDGKNIEAVTFIKNGKPTSLDKVICNGVVVWEKKAPQTSSYVKEIAMDTNFIGIVDQNVDLYEGMYYIPDGISYNSYVIIDTLIAVINTPPANFVDQWLNDLDTLLGGRQPNLLILLDAQPQMCAGVVPFMKKYVNAQVVGNNKTFSILEALYPELATVGLGYATRHETITNGDHLTVGSHALTFILTPMVTYPSSMIVHDDASHCLITGDMFSQFGTELDLETATENPLYVLDDYYTRIIQKYGAKVNRALENASALDIRMICPAHGKILDDSVLSGALTIYEALVNYNPNPIVGSKVTIVYASAYGYSKKTAEYLETKITQAGSHCRIHDLARDDIYDAVNSAFNTFALVICTNNINGKPNPRVVEFVNALVNGNYQKRTVAIVENYLWGGMAVKAIKNTIEGLKEITYLQDSGGTDISALAIQGEPTAADYVKLDTMAAALAKI